MLRRELKLLRGDSEGRQEQKVHVVGRLHAVQVIRLWHHAESTMPTHVDTMELPINKSPHTEYIQKLNKYHLLVAS